MKKTKTVIFTLIIFAVLFSLFAFFFLNNPFRVEDTIEGDLGRTELSREVEINKYFNDQYKGTYTAMEWGPAILGKASEDTMIVSLGHCSGKCPENALIINYLMYFRGSSESECKSAWGFDLNIVTEGVRHCLFKIPSESCTQKGGFPVYDKDIDVYLGCSTAPVPELE